LKRQDARLNPLRRADRQAFGQGIVNIIFLCESRGSIWSEERLGVPELWIYLA